MIPIHVRDESDFVHYPASGDDIRSVLRALPQGVTDGLTGLGEYHKGIQGIDKLVGIIDKEPYYEVVPWQTKKAEALVKMGQYPEAETVLASIEELVAGRRMWQRRIERLRKKCRRPRRGTQGD